jgi:hypothetical protein
MVQTEFSEVRFKGDTDRAEKYIKVSPYNQKILLILFISVSRPYHVNIDLVVMSTAQASSTTKKKKATRLRQLNFSFKDFYLTGQ